MRRQFGFAVLYNRIVERFTDAAGNRDEDAIQSYMPLLLRCWNRVLKWIIRYMRESGVAGEVVKEWVRTEFQTEVGQFPHVHGLLCTLEDRRSRQVTDRVVASTDFVGARRSSEVGQKQRYPLERFTEDLKIVKNEADFLDREDFLNEHLRHDCSKSVGRCLKEVTDREGNVRKICRRTPNRVTNTHLYERAQSNHSAKVLRILEKWGLTEESEDRIACVAGLDGRSPTPNGEDYPLLRPVVELEGGRHYPPCMKGDEMISQFIPDMAFLLCCSVNVQIVYYQWVKAYLEKYVAGAEEKAMASLRMARESDRNALTDVRINSYGIQNTKIGGVQARARQAQDQGGPAAAAAADGDRQPPHGPQDGTSAPPDSDSKKKGRRRDTRHRQALRISYTEMLWQLHDFPYVTSSVDCIHVASLPPELRCGWKA
mmetsp:Transcript_34363/g.98953  ORF Transcript_34363/g.98953 Transcript_34363/m.98953 type:complete len:428 (+) Transcript_34363:349-1632(+)